MNKIYKVVWNAARNSYMVGSEFIRGSHSAGSRRISGRKLKGLVAAALLAGAILSPAGLMPASAFLGWPDDGNKKEYATVQALDKETSDRVNADKNLQGQITDLQEKTEGGMEKDRKQDAAIAGGIVHDAIQDGAIIGGMIHDVVQDAAIDHNYEIDKAQGEAIGDLKHENDAQWGAIVGGQIHDAIQDGAIVGGMIHDAVQDAAIDHNYEIDKEQNSRLDTVEEVNKDQQSQIDSVRGEVGQEVADRTAADKELQSQIDDHSNRLGDVEKEAKKHTTVSTTDSNIQLTETVNDKGGRDYHIALNPDLKVDTVQAQSGSFGNIQINGTDENGQATNTINGLGNTTWDGVNFTSGQAATENQLWTVQQDVNANTAAIGSLNSRVNTLDGRIDKVGANAAALAALHPLDFDPDDKWDFAAGYGNYGNENAMAVGAFYRPNEDTMFSVGGSFGTGENMVNAGVSFKIGQGNHVSTSRVAMAKEIETLRHNVAQLTELVNQLVGAKDQISNSMTTPFPDVPENHWAYETVEQMRERGIVEGYPDGTFGGDRQMTRYEFATIVYRALQKGIGMNEDIQRLVDEFKPELALIRVDTIAQDSEGNPTIERVRVNKA